MTEIERLRLTHRLSDHTQAARDLALLRKHDKESAERFAFSTSLHADDILFALTKVASEEDIIANRQVKEDAKAAKEPAKEESEETKEESEDTKEETEEPAKEETEEPAKEEPEETKEETEEPAKEETEEPAKEKAAKKK